MNQLVHFENAKRELQLATNVDEVKDLRDKAEALRLYMKQAGESLWMQNQCAEIKVRAERRAGELLKATVKPGNPQLSHDVTIKTLPDGISRKQSSRWQAIADIPEPVFEEHIARAKDAGELTSSGLLKLSKKLIELRTKGTQLYHDIASGKRKTDDLELLCKPCNAIHYLELKFGKLPMRVIWEDSGPKTI